MSEIEQKTIHIKKTLQKYINKNLEEFIDSPKQTRYRNNVIFSIGYNKDGNIDIGPLLTSKIVLNSTENLTVSQTMIDICEIIKEYIINNPELGITNYDDYSGFWRHIHLRQNLKNEFSILFRFSNFDEYQETWDIYKVKFIEFVTMKVRELGYSFIQLYYQKCLGKSEPTKEHPYYLEFSKKELIIELLGKKFIISPGTFFQVNTYTAEILFQKVYDLFNINTSNTKKTLLLDICCGTGNYGILLNENFNKVIGIDSNENNIEIAKRNIKINNISNISFISEKIQDVIEQVLKEHIEYDIYIIVNPPRRGLYSDVLKSINQYIDSINQLVYVSCNSTTLKRDLDELNLENKKIEKIIPLNQFPNTSHYEIIVNIKN